MVHKNPIDPWYCSIFIIIKITGRASVIYGEMTSYKSYNSCVELKSAFVSVHPVYGRRLQKSGNK